MEVVQAMPPGLPTESVSGQEGWEWSRRQANRQARNPSTSSLGTNVAGEHSTTHRHTSSERSTNPLPNSSPPHPDLKQTNHNLQRVIDHYERLLRDKNRKLTNRDSNTPGRQRDSVLSVLKELLGM